MQRGQARTSYVPGVSLATARVAVGDHEQAIDALEHAYQRREHHMIWLGSFGIWKPLHVHPRFQRLLSKMNFPAKEVRA